MYCDGNNQRHDVEHRGSISQWNTASSMPIYHKSFRLSHHVWNSLAIPRTKSRELRNVNKHHASKNSRIRTPHSALFSRIVCAIPPPLLSLYSLVLSLLFVYNPPCFIPITQPNTLSTYSRRQTHELYSTYTWGIDDCTFNRLMWSAAKLTHP